jgi:Fic-DOC domain mobile mystery protein B
MTAAMDYPDGATPLDPDELAGLKFKHVTTREQLDELEQANIASGLRWLARHKGDVLTDGFAVTLHKRLFGDVWNWAGTFRKTGKNIGIEPVQIAVQLRALMDDARFWAEHNTYPASEAAMRLHHRLVQIHRLAWRARSPEDERKARRVYRRAQGGGPGRYPAVDALHRSANPGRR